MAQFGHAIHPQPRLLVHIRLAKGGWKVVVAYPLCSLRGGQTTTGQTKAWLAASKVDSSRVSKRLAMKAEQSLSATIVPLLSLAISQPILEVLDGSVAWVAGGGNDHCPSVREASTYDTSSLPRSFSGGHQLAKQMSCIDRALPTADTQVRDVRRPQQLPDR